MKRRTILYMGAVGLMLPLSPSAAQQSPDLSRKAVVYDPIAPKTAGNGYDVTVVEFFDYNCPYCRGMEPAFKAVLKADPKVRIVYRD